MSKADAKIERPCVICGYDLTGLPEEGSCPECGAPALQRDGAIFRAASADHLERMERGSALALIAAMLRLGLGAAWAAAGLLLPSKLVEHFSPATVLHAMADLTVAGLITIAWWTLTAQPLWSTHDRMLTHRRFLRRAIVALLLVSMLNAIAREFARAQAEVNPTGFGMRPVFTFLMLAGALVLVTEILTYIAGVLFLVQLCRRLGDDGLYRDARRLRWSVPAAFVLMAAISVVLRSAGWISILLGSAVFAVLYYWIWVRFLARLHRRIRLVAAQAATISPTVPPDSTNTEQP